VQDIEGEVLCGEPVCSLHISGLSDIFSNGTVSQFTLLASTKKGSKPDFHGSMAGPQAKELYEYFYSKVQQGYQAERVKDGVFQAMMQVGLINDGPVSCPTVAARVIMLTIEV
jgi:D-tyrosyl-tRNA(Tyr) deacylase